MCVCVWGIGVSCSSDSASYHMRIISRTVISNRFKAPGSDDSAQLLMVYEEVYVSKHKTLICWVDLCKAGNAANSNDLNL